MRPGRTPLHPITLLAAVMGVACGGSRLPAFQDVETAPQSIAASARAVVRIQTAGEIATGTFISSSGLLLTNNHVLGSEVCPIEGCFFKLTFQHQLGVKPSDPQIVFGVPMAADIGRDVAVVQVFSDSVSRLELSTPDFLTPQATATAASLVGTTVYVVGHPEGRLKKWSSGAIVDSTGDWFEATDFILPGSSGSAVLNGSGELVGIVHRSPTGEDLVSSAGYNADSVGTAAAAIVDVTTLPAVMRSTLAPTTPADLVTNDRIYLNANAVTADVSGQQVPLLDTLGDACDAALARTDYQAPEDLTAALVPCSDAMLWIECRTDATPAAYTTQCPTTDAQTWTTRYQKMNALWNQLYGGVSLTALSFGVAALQDSRHDGIEVGAVQLLEALSNAQAPLDFNVAFELSAFAVSTYQNEETVSVVKGFSNTPGYFLFGTQIANAALWLRSNGLMTDDDVRSVLGQLLGDPNTSVGTRLFIEDQEYQLGFLN